VGAGVGVRDEIADFGAFYQRTYPRAFGIAYGIAAERDLAEDVTQDAYVAAYRERRGYRGDGTADAWLYRIVVNTAISTLRRRRIRIAVRLDPAFEAGPAVGDPTAATVDQVALLDSLQHLDVRARAAVILRYYADLDYATIAGILGTSATNVGAILSRSLDRLRGVLEPEPEADTAAAAAGHQAHVSRRAVWHG
jgi:RNA polymerase sigma factor (sigma-70 family)